MKKVKRNVSAALLQAQIKELSLEDIATSSTFQRLMQNSINALLQSHNRARKIRFSITYDPYDPLTACTDDHSCYMNAANEMYSQDPGSEQPIPIKKSCMRMYGAGFHEGGHVLYTCFSEMYRMMDLFKNGNLDIPPETDEDFQDAYDELIDVMKNDKALVLQGFSAVPIRNFITQIYMNLSNCVEDGRIERLLLKNDTRFSGLAAGLIELRDYHKAMGMSWDMSQQDIPTFMNLCLLYAKYHSVGAYTGGFEAFDKAKPIIDQMLDTHEAKVFSQLNQKLMLCIWPQIKELIVEANGSSGGEDSEEEGSGENSSGNSAGSSSGQSSGNSSGQASNGSSEGSSEDSSDGSSKDSENSEENSESSNGGNPNEESLEEKLNKLLNEISKNIPNESSFQNDEKESSEKSSDAESSNESNGEGPKGVTNVEAPAQSSSTTLEATIGEIMREIADEKARDVLAEQAREETAGHIKSAGRGFAEYRGTRVLNVNPSDYGAKLDLATEAAIKKAAREIRRHLETDQRTGVSKRKFSGKKFHAEKVVNRDFRYFENKATRKDLPKVKVGLVIDESGSMSRDNRWDIARSAAITLYKIFEYIPNLDIAIYGHSTFGEVEIYDYAEFGIKQKDIIGRLNNVSARSGNIDIVPITAMAENLLKQDADTRIMFIITDGLPYSYVREMTPEQELSEAANKYTRKGIEIIVASIGEDEDLIREIYKNQRFLNISNPSDLPKKVVDVIKRKL